MEVDAIVRALYAAFSARDLERVQALTTEDVQFWPEGTAAEVGRDAPYNGHDGLREYLADVEAVWASLEVEPRDLRFAGQGVIAFGVARGRRRDDGSPLDVPVIWVFKLRDGRIASVRAVGTPAEATQAAG